MPKSSMLDRERRQVRHDRSYPPSPLAAHRSSRPVHCDRPDLHRNQHHASQLVSVWVRDEDGRVFEAVWSEGTASYWWDLDGESPVDPVEFMPHPLDVRYQMPTPPGNQIRTAESDGEDAVPVTGQLPIGTASTTQIAMSADALCAKAGISLDLIDDGTTRVVVRASAYDFSKVFADDFQPAYIHDVSGGLGSHQQNPLHQLHYARPWTGPASRVSSATRNGCRTTKT